MRKKSNHCRDNDTSLDDVNITQSDLLIVAKPSHTTYTATKRKVDSALGWHLREANENLVLATLQAQALAEHDFLTGLPNRPLFNDRLSQAIILAQRQRKKVALLFIDLDNFKHINDSLGHAIGDQLLQAMAKRLQDCARQSDTVSRQGGDEFIMLLVELDRGRDAAIFAEKLLHSLAEPYVISGHQLHITVSIGISVYPDDGNNAEAVMINADTAMYHAKENGRNKYQFFTQHMNDLEIERQSLEASLHQAIQLQEFVLLYQPKVDLDNGTITGAEALIRWHHPTRGMLLPEQFISIAEDCGLIVPIGKWVLREACRQMKAWMDQGLQLKQIAVNISAAEFRNKRFLQSVRDIFNDTGLPPSYVEIEVTESVLMQELPPSTTILRELESMGLKLAIDNFGTGYSSLRYLPGFLTDTLKIDQSFVQGIHLDNDKAVIVSAIIAMGKCLEQRLVAEGVETSEQFAFLRSHGCDEAQGYLFSLPLTAHKFTLLLEAKRHNNDETTKLH